MRGALGMIHSASGTGSENKESPNGRNEEETVEQILRYDKSATGICCQLQARPGTQITHTPMMKDVTGIVALLGKVEDDNLSRPYAGELIADDPQRRLVIEKPGYLNEETPGFLGFAVNLVNIDTANLYGVTSTGHGLRETLFYTLFSRLQVSKARADMLQALPLITDGAVSWARGK